MQQRGCEAIEVILSKYADNEATPTERERVESHIIGCPHCARRLTEYRDVSALFIASPKREPEPQLRVKLFREIGKVKEDEQRKQREAEHARPWYLPAPLHTPRKGLARFSGAISSAAAVAMMALAFLAFSQYAVEPTSTTRPVAENDLTFPPVPTVPATIAARPYTNEPGDVGPNIPPQSTRVGDILLSPVVEGSATVYPTAHVGEAILKLRQPTPVLEEGDPGDLTAWHVVRDAVYGYAVSYPPNWWAHLKKSTRSFFPWTAAGMRYAPYWIDLRVEGNPEGLTVDTAPAWLGEGARKVGSTWVRMLSSDRANRYDELYRFDTQHIYVLRLTVPWDSPSDEFESRFDEAQAIFSAMSGRIAFAASGTAGGYAPVLFLKGTTLWSVDAAGKRLPVTRGGPPVRRFVLSPDLRTVAYLTARQSADTWADALRVVSIENGSASTPSAIWAEKGLEVHDFAWYGDRELVAIARSSTQGYGIFKISLPRAMNGDLDAVERIAVLNEVNAVATDLAVSPDRQLITYLSPVSTDSGTDIYALRPDGTDLKRLVSHTDAQAAPSEGSIFASGDGAIKSYVWLDGQLENNGYRYSLLFTFGSAASPTLYHGGALYTAPGARGGPALDLKRLGLPDTDKMDIIHMAYSTSGKLAVTGFYRDYKYRANLLAGLWTADLVNGRITNVTARLGPADPTDPKGIADLQWSPDGRSLVYRETHPQSPTSMTDRYEGETHFRIMKLDLSTDITTPMYSSQP